MNINASNGSTSVSTLPQFTPRCLDVTTHLCGREVESSSTHWPATDETHKHGARDAYITVGVSALERGFEVPEDERDSFRRKTTDQTMFLDIEDARKLRDALTEALDCADVK